jgi:hypothetical protein
MVEGDEDVTRPKDAEVELARVADLDTDRLEDAMSKHRDEADEH